MARVLILWSRPAHLSVADAEAWARGEVGRLLESDGIERVELTRLERASEQQSAPWQWLLELHLRDGADGRECVEGRECAEWLGDLRLLGMRPSVVLADGATPIGRDAG